MLDANPAPSMTSTGTQTTADPLDRESPPMQDLTLIGVHEDGLHLLLADGEGNRYTVPLDDSLRAAARRDRPRLGPPGADADRQWSRRAP